MASFDPDNNSSACNTWFGRRVSELASNTGSHIHGSFHRRDSNVSILIEHATQGNISECMEFLRTLDPDIVPRVILAASETIQEEWAELSFTDLKLERALLIFLQAASFHSSVKISKYSPASNGRGLFCTLDGESHTFGIEWMADQFRQVGWTTDICLEIAREDCLQKARTTAFDIICISISQDGQLNNLADFVHDLRLTSDHLRTKILIGGGLVADRPSAFSFLGADFVGSSLQDAIRFAGEHVSGLRPQ